MEIDGEGVCTVRISAEGSGAKNILLFISMNVCFAVKRLKVAPESKNSVAGIVMCGTGAGGRMIRKKLRSYCLPGRRCRRFLNG